MGEARSSRRKKAQGAVGGSHSRVPCIPVAIELPVRKGKEKVQLEAERGEVQHLPEPMRTTMEAVPLRLLSLRVRMQRGRVTSPCEAEQHASGASKA